MRTSLGLVVAGVGLAALADLAEDPGWFGAAAPVICLLGGLAVVVCCLALMGVVWSVTA